MYFRQNASGKNCFISVDSRKISEIRFIKHGKAKSFTSNDIMLHFFVLDILQPGVQLSPAAAYGQVRRRVLILFCRARYFGYFHRA